MLMILNINSLFIFQITCILQLDKRFNIDTSQMIYLSKLNENLIYVYIFISIILNHYCNHFDTFECIFHCITLINPG